MSSEPQTLTMTPAAQGFAWPVRVYYEDTDAGGVVFYANYLRFMERARTEFLRVLGFEQERLARERGLLFAVRSVRLDFLAPARLDDMLEVTVAIRSLGRVSLVFEQQVLCGRDGAKPELLSRGEVKIACLDAGNFRPRGIPEDILKALSAPEAVTRER